MEEKNMAKFDNFVKKVTGTVQSGLDEVNDTVKKGLTHVNNKAEEISTELSLNAEIEDIDKKIEQMYINIGKKAFEINAGIFDSEITFIKELKERRTHCDAAILSKKGLIRCWKCDEAIPVKSCYCLKCGAKIEE